MKKRNRILTCFALLLGVLGVGWIIHLVRQMPNSSQVHNYELDAQTAFSAYSGALVSRDYKTAFQSCSSEFKSVTPFERFVAQQRQMEELNGRLLEIKQVGLAIHGIGNPLDWTAVIGADYKYERSTVRFYNEFHRTNGSWFLTNYRPE